MKRLNLDVLSIKGNAIVYKPVDCVSTSNQTISGLVGSVISGVTVTTETRVLLTGQSNLVENGIYVNNIRSRDLEVGDSAYGLIMFDIPNKLFWISQNTSTDIIGTNNVVFTKMSTSNLGDNNIITPLNNQAQIYNSVSGKWENKYIVNSFNSRTGDVLPATGDYSLSGLSGVNIVAPVVKQYLRYSGSQWANSNIALNDINNVLVTSPTANQILEYDTTLNGGLGGFKNVSRYYYREVINITGGPAGGSIDAIHVLNNATDLFLNTLATVANIGRRIMLINLNTSNTIYLGDDCFIDNVQYFGGHDLSSPSFGIIELMIAGLNSYYVLNNTNFYNLNFDTRPIGQNRLDLLRDTTITNPLNNQYLKYSSGYWINSALPTYNLDSLTDVVITSPVTNQLLVYNGTNWVNSTTGGTLRDAFSFNSDGNLAASNYLYVNAFGQNANETRCQLLLPYNINITGISIYLVTSPGIGNSRTFTIRVNSSIVGSATITNTSTTLTQILNINATAGQLLSLQNTNTNASNSLGMVTIRYTY